MPKAHPYKAALPYLFVGVIGLFAMSIAAAVAEVVRPRWLVVWDAHSKWRRFVNRWSLGVIVMCIVIFLLSGTRNAWA